MIKATLRPTIDNTYQIEYLDAEPKFTFEKILHNSQKMEQAGDIKAACDARYDAFQQLMALLPEDELISLDWEDRNSCNAMMLLSFTAIDHFLIGDFEMCAAMLELLLDLDPEDHTDAIKRLAYCYVALGEFELFDEIINDVSDKHPEKCVIKMWSDFERNGKFDDGDLIRFKKTFAPYYEEFTCEEHPASEAYMADIESERPSRQTLAREMWLQTEHLWAKNPEFIQALR